MLVLMMKAGEKVYITGPDGKQILVTFQHADNRRIRLGIEADRQYKVLRESLVQKSKGIANGQEC